MDRLTGWILAASVGVVAAAATPALLRTAGVELPVAAPLSATPLALPHPPPEIRGSEDPALEGDDDDSLAEPHGQLGQTRGRVIVHARPSTTAGVVGKVDAGELVTVLRVAGEWALVYYGGADNLVVGWAKKSEIAIR